jgi:endogenous inhibitor of DNA gyrase (YacG/DUF329 family)
MEIAEKGTKENCAYCKKPYINKTQSRKYCSDECQQTAQIERIKAKQDKIKEDLKKFMWQRTTHSQYVKFQELFGEGQRCTLCDMGQSESISKFGFPLIAELRAGIRDIRVLNINSWQFFCFNCKTNVEILKD